MRTNERERGQKYENILHLASLNHFKCFAAVSVKAHIPLQWPFLNTLVLVQLCGFVVYKHSQYMHTTCHTLALVYVYLVCSVQRRKATDVGVSGWVWMVTDSLTTTWQMEFTAEILGLWRWILRPLSNQTFHSQFKMNTNLTERLQWNLHSATLPHANPLR